MDHPVETNTLEVRWFGTGTPPEELSEWISELGENGTTHRTDLYFAPVEPSFNLKLRGGADDRLEIKHRLGTGTDYTFSPTVSGTVEQWYKWSFSLAHTPSSWTEDGTGLWLPVEKTRLLYTVDETERRSVDDVSETDVAVHVEVTEVTARSKTGWTCCLEAAGQPAALEDVVAAVGVELFGDGVPIELTTEASVGYVEWLRRLTGGVRPATEVLVPSKRSVENAFDTDERM